MAFYQQTGQGKWSQAPSSSGGNNALPPPPMADTAGMPPPPTAETAGMPPPPIDKMASSGSTAPPPQYSPIHSPTPQYSPIISGAHHVGSQQGFFQQTPPGSSTRRPQPLNIPPPSSAFTAQQRRNTSSLNSAHSQQPPPPGAALGYPQVNPSFSNQHSGFVPGHSSNASPDNPQMTHIGTNPIGPASYSQAYPGYQAGPTDPDRYPASALSREQQMARRSGIRSSMGFGGGANTPHALTSFQVGTPMGSPKTSRENSTSDYFGAQTPRRTTSPRPLQRIDPTQIPRPRWQDMEPRVFYTRSPFAEKLSKQGETGSAGMLRYVPPPSLSVFTVKDEGNASPRFVRSTLNCIPTQNSLLAMTQLPFALIVQPLAVVDPNEDPVPVLNFGESGPVRCQRCRGYINPFVRWLRNGKKWLCCLCGVANDVPDTYQCSLDASGQRRDRESRPELCLGSVDYAVGPAYCVRPLQEPIYVFAIDVSEYANQTGFLDAAIDAVRTALRALPGGPRSRVGFMTFSSQVHFYRPNRSGDCEPQMLIMTDIAEPFSPLPAQEWLVTLGNSEATLLSLLDQIPTLVMAHRTGRQQGSSLNKTLVNGMGPHAERCALGAAMKAGQEALGPTGGKLIVLSSLPPTCGIGAGCGGRLSSSFYGTDQERTLFSPMTNSSKHEEQEIGAFYEELGKSSALLQVSIDLYLGQQEPDFFFNVATLGLVTQSSGGKIHLITGSMHKEDKRQELRESLAAGVRACQALEAVLKVRCGQGVDIQKTSGPGNHGQGTTRGEVELATMDVDTTITTYLRLDGMKIENDSEVCMQAALLYTTPDTGQRRVRVHTLCLATHEQINNIFRLSDLDAVVKIFAMQGALATTLKSSQEAQDHIINTAVAPLVGYRERCAPHSPPGQLILPESLKLLPFFLISLLKAIIVRNNTPDSSKPGGIPDPRADERAFQQLAVHSMSVESTMKYLYPRLYPLRDMDLSVGSQYGVVGAMRMRLPDQTPTASSEYLLSDGAFLLDAGMQLHLYLGYAVPDALMAELFGESFDASDVASLQLAPESDMANQVLKVVQCLRSSHFPFKPLKIIKSGTQVSAEEDRFLSLLMEDKTKHDVSYVDFLCKIHKLIQQKIG